MKVKRYSNIFRPVLICFSLLFLAVYCPRKYDVQVIKGYLMLDCNTPAANQEVWIGQIVNASKPALELAVTTTDSTGYFAMLYKPEYSGRISLMMGTDKVLTELPVNENIVVDDVYLPGIQNDLDLVFSVQNAYSDQDTLWIESINEQTLNNVYWVGPFVDGTTVSVPNVTNFSSATGYPVAYLGHIRYRIGYNGAPRYTRYDPIPCNSVNVLLPIE